MSPISSVKTTGQIRRDKQTLKRRFVVAVGVSVVVSLSSTAKAAPAFERGAFSKIDFSAGCQQKQWTLTPEGSLELLIAPSSEQPCEATLEFYAAPEITEQTAIGYEYRATQRGSSLKVGIQQSPDSDVLFGDSIHLHADWRDTQTDLRQLSAGGSLRSVSALHFVATRESPAPTNKETVMIRGIRFYESAPVALKPSVDPVVVPPLILPPSKRIAMVAPSPKESRVHRLWKWIPKPSASRKLIWPLFALMALVGSLRYKSKHRRILSPLYEVNVRTWKTHRDANEVVQFGGFKNISLSDLKSIKQAGFSAVWFMGIWEIGAQVRALSKNYASDFQGSPYAIYDYAVSSDLGTEQDFRDLVARAHSLRLSVIIDFVPNHMGLDSPWLNTHPEFFIHRVLEPAEASLPDDELKQRYPGHFPYRTPSYPDGNRRGPKTIMVAYGRDPYFYPWIDTAQLDYAQPELRRKLIETLCHWARTVDGVRCDMAMLVLRDQVKNHRHPTMSWETFNQMMPHEFWTEAVQAVKRVNPNFVFIAETYWAMEGYLQKVGFDYTYNKPLYEAICNAVHSGHAEGMMNFIRLLGTDFLKHSVHFLENHDEERAMNSLGEERQRAAAAILCTLPGIALLHQGQLEGKRERLPVQRVVPLHKEVEHTGLQSFYRRLLHLTALPIFQEGRMIPLYSNTPALACYARTDENNKVMVVVNTSHRKQSGIVFLMPGLRLQSGAPYKLTDLFYEFKRSGNGTVQPFYVYPGAKLINQGLYVELDPFDSHIFVIESQQTLPITERVLQSTRQTLQEWPINRLVRRLHGIAFTRSSDTHLAANPTGRQS